MYGGVPVRRRDVASSIGIKDERSRSFRTPKIFPALSIRYMIFAMLISR